MLNDISYGIKMWTDFLSVLLQFTRLTDVRTYGQTDGRTFSLLDRVCIPRSAVKIVVQKIEKKGKTCVPSNKIGLYNVLNIHIN